MTRRQLISILIITGAGASGYVFLQTGFDLTFLTFIIALICAFLLGTMTEN